MTYLKNPKSYYDRKSQVYGTIAVVFFILMVLALVPLAISAESGSTPFFVGALSAVGIFAFGFMWFLRCEGKITDDFLKDIEQAKSAAGIRSYPSHSKECERLVRAVIEGRDDEALYVLNAMRKMVDIVVDVEKEVGENRVGYFNYSKTQVASKEILRAIWDIAPVEIQRFWVDAALKARVPAELHALISWQIHKDFVQWVLCWQMESKNE